LEIEITPEPTPEERDAILAALERAGVWKEPEPARTSWWEAGVRENVEGEEEEL
jgi:hypothetical protein